MESTANIQTRQPSEQAVDNVMMKALKHYEDNLQTAKDNTEDQVRQLNSAIELENYNK